MATLNKRILSTLGIFSGLESLMILCSIVKMKLVALWLGTVGVGLFGIFNTTVETVTTLTGLGLRQSAVRDVAQAGSDKRRLSLLTAMITLWSLLAGGFGAVVVLMLSPILAKWLFGDWTMWWQFALLSATMLFNTCTDGQKAILQGVGHLKRLARATLWATLSALAVSIPMYRFLGEVSVILSITVYSVLGVIFVLAYRFVPPERVTPTRADLRHNSGFVKLGTYMALAAFLSSLAQLVFQGWLNRSAGTGELGLYQAGSVIIIRYVGLIFVAAGMEYYPRLSAHIFSRKRSSLFVSHEISLLLLLLAPCILLFLLLREWVVELLYSREFFAIIPFITLAILGTIFRTFATCVAYTIVARGDGRTYVLTEGLDAAIGLGLNILCFSLWGLTGLGISYIAWFLIYSVMVLIVYVKRYGMHLNLKSWQTLGVTLLTSVGGYCAVEVLPYWLACVCIGLGVLGYVRPLRRAIRSRK